MTRYLQPGHGVAGAKPPKRQREGALSDAIREALACEPGLMLERNARCAVVKSNRMVRGGLGGNGTADLVGVLSVPRMLGGLIDQIGLFVALEVKAPGEIPTAAAIDRAWSKLPPVARAMRSLDLAGPALKTLPDDERRMLEQSTWLASVRERGGFAAYVDSVAGARAAIARARTGARE